MDWEKLYQRHPVNEVFEITKILQPQSMIKVSLFDYFHAREIGYNKPVIHKYIIGLTKPDLIPMEELLCLAKHSIAFYVLSL